jgi:hypothetical protein
VWFRTIAWFALAAVLMTATYPLAVKRFSRGLVSPYPKADTQRRLAAAIFDGAVSLVFVAAFLALPSAALLLAAATYVLLRDALNGQSLGKFLQSLVVINVRTRARCGFREAVGRNFLFVIPGANFAALVLETRTMLRDPQGQRLGDRIAQTQVVDGYGARELIRSIMDQLVAAMRTRAVVPRRRRVATLRRNRTSPRIPAIVSGAMHRTPPASSGVPGTRQRRARGSTSRFARPARTSSSTSQA